jgi:hypothetical protein
MSTIKPRKKATTKTAASKNAGAKKATAKKATAKTVASKKSATKKSAARTSAGKKSVAKKAVAKKTASKATKPAAKRVARTSDPRKTANTARATRSNAAPAAPKRAAKAPVSDANRTRRVSPKVSVRHFREVLQAKQERVRQGPNYPPANAFTGRPASLTALSGGLDPHAPLPATGTPTPEALTGANSLHGRGNQGMRKQK